MRIGSFRSEDYDLGVGRRAEKHATIAGPDPDGVEDVVMEPILFERQAKKVPTHDRWRPMALEPGQFELRTRSYAPFHTFGGGFEGDDRGPSARLDVTSRITNKAVIDTRGWNELAGVRLDREEVYSDPSSWTGVKQRH